MGVIICVFKYMDNKRKQILPVIFLFLFSALQVSGQVPSWRVGLFSFFDNVEFGGSALKIPQTMSGVQFNPEAGLAWDSVHSIQAGLNLLHEFGSDKAINIFYPVAYYKLNTRPVKFIMGAFPRSLVLNDYPRLFFQDSISYYRPLINGMSLLLGNESHYLNVWLDWTGRQSDVVREAFFVGLSGRFSYNILYIQHFSYMFHFAGTSDPLVNEALHDNLLFLTSAGTDLSGKLFFDRLDFNIGWVAGMERARADMTGWKLMSGLLFEARAEYSFIGLFNSYYRGEQLLNYYGDHDNELYWGDPVYRAGSYNRTDLYLRFLKSKKVNLELTYSLHFLESTVYHEQLLKVRVNLDNN